MLGLFASFFSQENVPMTRKISRDLKLMISFSALRNISDLFLGTFFVSFIMHLARNEILAVSTYKLFEYIATLAGFFIIANLCKRYNKVAVFAMNLIPQALLLIAIIGLGDNVVEYIVPLGLLYGFGAAVYHLPMHTMIGEKVDADTMPRYIGIKHAVTYLVKVATPVIMGLFITTGSYTETAWALLGLTGIEMIMVLFLQPSRHRTRTNTDFCGFWRCIMRFPVVRTMFIAEILRGFTTSGALGTVITMYTVYMFHTDVKLGAFTTIFAFCSIMASYLFGRFAQRQHFPKILRVCTIAAIGAMTLFVCRTTPQTFLLYNFMYATAISLMDQINDTNMYNLAQSQCVKNNHRVEYFVLRDGALFVGRWIGFVALMYIGVFGDMSWLRYFLIMMTGAVMLGGRLSERLSPNIRAR